MAVSASIDADIVEDDPEFLSVSDPQREPLVRDRAVALRAQQGFADLFRGGQHVIEQPDFPKVKIARQMKSEKIVLQRVRDQLKQDDLALYRDPCAAIFDLPSSHSRPNQQWSKIDPGAVRAQASEPAETSGRKRHRAQWPQTRITHTCFPSTLDEVANLACSVNFLARYSKTILGRCL